MRRNKGNNRRLIVMVVVIAALALAGLSLIRVGEASADRVAETTATVKGNQVGSPAAAEAPMASGSEPSVYAAVIKMLSALVVVILLAYGALYALRRLMGKRYGGNGRSSLEVLETTSVGPHKTISLVRVGQRSILVGVTDQQIATLTELSVEETEAINAESVPAEPRVGFSAALSAAAGRLKTVGSRKRTAVLET